MPHTAALELSMKGSAVKKSYFVLGALLAVSLLANAYLFRQVVNWQEAWTEQILATSTVEQIYKGSEADTSFEAVKTRVAEEFGQYEIVPLAPSDNQWPGTDEDAILVHGTKLFFKYGKYIGSKADLPEGLVHWRMNEEF